MNSIAVKLAERGMLKSIRLKNFKCYKDSLRVELAPLTVIIGCNNAGKSALIQPLLALRQTLRDPSYAARFVTAGPTVDLGGYFDIVHGGSEKARKHIAIELERELKAGTAKSPLGKTLRQATRLSIDFSFNSSANRFEVAELSFADPDGKNLWSFSETKNRWNLNGIPKQIQNRLSYQFHNFLARMLIERPGKKKGRPNDDHMDVFDVYWATETQISQWAELINSLNHVTPTRRRVPWHSGIGQRHSAEFGGENLFRALASQDQVSDEGTMLKRVNHWMSKRFKALTNLRWRQIDQSGLVRSLIADVPDGPKGINVAGMGEGISQILPIIASVLRMEPQSSLVIEQPEIHLHPALQADLCELFIETVSDGNRQLLIETHSEHLVLRLRTAVAQKRIDPKLVSILFVEQKGGESEVVRLHMNGRGHFDYWPKGFFDEGYQEAMKLAMAQPIEG